MVTILVLIQNIFDISYAKDIAFAFVILGPVGTIAFARALRGDMEC
jgi:energy-converting hydrogenase B subunit B